MRADCPKCGSTNAWYLKTEYDLAVKCLCGYYKIVYTLLGSIEVQSNEAGANVRLPKNGSNLRKTLLVLSVEEGATSGELTRRLGDMGERFTVSDVASYLTILRSKGLVESPIIRRGVAGGSSWKVTDMAIKLLGF